MPTGARGEAILTVDGKEYRVLFTNRALAEAEKALGKSTTAIMRAAINNELGIGDLAVLIQVGMNAARRDAMGGTRLLPANAALDLLDHLGFLKALVPVVTAITEVLTYDPESGGEGGDAEETPPA